jgi:hypothetical protein
MAHRGLKMLTATKHGARTSGVTRHRGRSATECQKALHVASTPSSGLEAIYKGCVVEHYRID